MSGTEVPNEPPPSYEHVLEEAMEEAVAQTASGAAAPPLPQRPAASPAPVASPSSHTTGSRPHRVRPSSSSSSEAESRVPTTVPTPNRALLRNGCLLVYPKGWTRCHKCGNTGYKSGDPTHPCRKCWRQYGRPYSSTLRHAYEGSGNDSLSHNGCVLQQPLPPTIGGQPASRPPAPRPPPMPPVPGSFPMLNLDNHYGIAGPSYCGSGHSGSTYNLPGPSYMPPPQRPPPQPPLPPRRDSTQVFPEDRYSDAPPNYVMVNKTDKKTRLPHQEYPTEERPRPPPRPPMPPRPPPPPQFSQPTGWYGGQPPPGALVVMPGDPRIGGVLCPECGGSGDAPMGLSSFLFGVDDECPRCGGSGRVPPR